MIKNASLVAGAAMMAFAVAAGPAQAKCLQKAAIATAPSEKGAKWFALETMVQSVSWGLWPAFIADGSTPGWKITKQRYSCKNNGGSMTCKGWATFCPTK